jgi:hypothetical protein
MVEPGVTMLAQRTALVLIEVIDTGDWATAGAYVAEFLGHATAGQPERILEALQETRTEIQDAPSSQRDSARTAASAEWAARFLQAIRDGTISVSQLGTLQTRLQGWAATAGRSYPPAPGRPDTIYRGGPPGTSFGDMDDDDGDDNIYPGGPPGASFGA